MPTLPQVVERYILSHDLRGSTETQYRRVCRLFTEWRRGDDAVKTISTDTVNRYLKHLQDAGKSSWYVRSTRNTLRAVLRDKIDARQLRQIKTSPTRPGAWTSVQLQRILDACTAAGDHEPFFRRLTLLGYHTGLSQCDLYRLCWRHVNDHGIVRIERAKTGKHVVAWIPPDVLDLFDRSKEHLLKRPYSNEMVRRVWRKITAKAGTHGSLKKLRSTSGTRAEEVAPGRGHEQLANTRQVFERHYLASDHQRQPIQLPRIGNVG